LELTSYLIMPIQRLPRYVLLLQELVNHTRTDHPDYQNLKSALDKMQDVADYVNDKKRMAENLNGVLTIQSHLTGEIKSLAKPHRRYVRQGPLVLIEGEKKYTRYLFLFNDILIVTRRKEGGTIGTYLKMRGVKTPKTSKIKKEVKKEPKRDTKKVKAKDKTTLTLDDLKGSDHKFKFLFLEDLNQALIDDLPDKPKINKTKAMTNLLTITTTSGRVLQFSLSSLEEKLSWMRDLDEAVNALLENKRSRLDAHMEKSFFKKREAEAGGHAIEGKLFKHSANEWKERYFALTGYTLTYWRDKEEKEKGEKSREGGSVYTPKCSVSLVPVMDRDNCFQIATDRRIYYLAAESGPTRMAWINAVRASVEEYLVEMEKLVREPGSGIIHQEEHTQLKELRMANQNQCAECTKNDPHFVSVTFGVFLCDRCARAHKKLGSWSIVKSTRLSEEWSKEEIENLKKMGNSRAKEMYRSNIPQFMHHPNVQDSYETRLKWVKSKYATVIKAHQKGNKHTTSEEHVKPSKTRSGENSREVISKYEKSGILYRFGHTHWRKYKFVLKRGELLYFKSREPKPSGVIELVLCSPIPHSSVELRQNQYYAFEIVTPTRKYTCATLSKEETLSWVRYLNGAIKMLQKTNHAN